MIERRFSILRFKGWLWAVGILIGLSLLIWRVAGSLAVQVTYPSRGAAVQAVYATGTVEAAVMLPIATRWAGRLSELKVDENDEVKKDQILARLENEDLQGALASARARADIAKRDFTRSKQLYEQNTISKQDYERAVAESEASSANASQAEAQAGYMSLIAPNNGKVIRRDGEIGQLIPAGQPIFWMSVDSPLRISAEVDEEDRAKVQVDQQVLIRADAFPGQVFQGKVKSITPKGDPVARSYRVRIEITEETPLQIGMTAETNIIVSEKQNALLVPSSAIDQDAVWVVENSKLKRKPVVIGVRGLSQSEIISGITATDLLVTSLQISFHEGQRVRTQQTQQ